MYILSSPAECELSHIVFNYFLQLLVGCPSRPCCPSGAAGVQASGHGVHEGMGLMGNDLI